MLCSLHSSEIIFAARTTVTCLKTVSFVEFRLKPGLFFLNKQKNFTFLVGAIFAIARISSRNPKSAQRRQYTAVHNICPMYIYIYIPDIP